MSELSHQPYTVLIAEDELLVRVGIKSSIPWEQLGLRLESEISNGTALLNQLQELPPDILLLDINLPGVSGLEVMRVIREQKLPTKVIIISGLNDFPTVREALRLGACEYIHKPQLKQGELIDVLQRITNDLQPSSQPSASQLPTDRAQAVDRVMYLQNILSRPENLPPAQEDTILFGPGPFLLIHFVPKALAGQGAIADRNNHFLANSLANLAAESVSGKAGVQFIHAAQNQFYLFIFSNSEKPFADQARELETQISQVFRRFANLDVRFSISDPFTDFANFSQVVEQVRWSLLDEMWMAGYVPEETYLGTVRDIVCFLQSHYAEDISLDTLAEQFRLSRYYISRLFKSETGYNLFSFLNQIRIGASKNLLLETDMRIYEVADTVGFNSAINFNYAFNRVVGISPSTYREQKRAKGLEK